MTQLTAKEKAKEIVEKITKVIWESGNTVSKPMVKQLAVMQVDEILNSNHGWNKEKSQFVFYWQQVKIEIENL